MIFVRYLTIACCIFLLFATSVSAADVHNGKLHYRGFVVDVAPVQDLPNFPDIIAYAKQQLDMVADSGVRPQILEFFKSEKISIVPGTGRGGGRTDMHAITMDPKIDSPDKPVYLHEYMHAMNFSFMPGGKENPDILTFYRRAKENHFYPDDSYVMKNPAEFFAVTASCYLWGTVDRPPYNREEIRKQQPVYYKWLGDTLGVQK